MIEDIKNPKRYTGKTGMQVLDVIDEFDLDFWRGNALKYIIRCTEKGGVDDINKAIVYLKDYKKRLLEEDEPENKSIDPDKRYIWKNIGNGHYLMFLNRFTVEFTSHLEKAAHYSFNEFKDEMPEGFSGYNWELIETNGNKTGVLFINHD